MTMAPSAEPGTGLQVVTPGGADDPFSSGGTPSPEGGQAGPAGGPPAPIGQQNPAAAPPQAPAPAQNPATPQTPPSTSFTQADLDARIRAATSGLDRRINTLTSDLQAANDRAAQAERDAIVREREAKLNGLSDDEQARLRQSWDLEDAQKTVQTQQAAVADYHKAVEGLRLLGQYAQYGLTEEELLACESIEDMEILAKDKAIQYLQNGGKPPAADPASSSPPGVNAPVDVGGNSPPANPGPQLLTTTGVDSMAANVKSLFAQPTGVPWA